MPTRRDFLKTAAAVAVSPYLPTKAAALSYLAAQAVAPKVSASSEVFADFESGDYDGWTLAGNCWGSAPASDRTFQGRISGFQGKRFLCSLHPILGASAVGKATSKEFSVERPFIDFLIGGGNYPEEACLNLIVDGKAVRTATGNDRSELSPASWDVSSLLGDTAHFEVVDTTKAAARGYVMVDDIRMSDTPSFRELVPGQNAFFCFANEDTAGREFQRLFATSEGRSQRALIDLCVDRVTEQLALDLVFIDRNDIERCDRLLRTEIDRILNRYQVRNTLSKQLIAANACSALTALLTKYDYELALLVAARGNTDSIAHDYVVSQRDPAVVLRRGKAVCAGIASLEQRLALSLQDLGVECLVANGHTRDADNRPHPDINHSWTIYHLADKSLWAPSDTTRALAVLQSAKTLPKAKLVRSSLVLVDPLLRDMYTMFHFNRECRVGHPGKYVNDRVVNITTHREWAAFHETHPYILKSAHTAMAQIDKEDAARLK